VDLEQTLKNWIDRNLPSSAGRRVKRAGRGIQGWWYRNNLNRLACVFGSDKWGLHWYTPHYERYFRPLKSRRLNVLEIGVGGYEHSNMGGGSLRMWKSYFRRSRIVGIDLYDKSHLSEPRIDIRQCDQTDEDKLTRLSAEYEGFDIVIDDGSHRNEHVIRTFEILFPLLRPQGIYVIEDIQTAYWPTWGGGMNSPNSSIAYFKNLIDGLNHAEYPVSNYQPTFWDNNIVEISFFHNIVFLQKGKNDEGTNDPALINHELAQM
jgi:Methyltransferase domain